MVIVADDVRRKEYDKKLGETAFKELKDNNRVDFLSYDDLGKQYERLVEDSYRQFIL